MAASETPARFSISAAGGDSHRLVDRGAPFGVALIDPAHEVHVGPAQLLGDRADLADAEREPIDRQDRRDLVTAAAEKRLVGDVELGARDLALLHLQAER